MERIYQWNLVMYRTRSNLSGQSGRFEGLRVFASNMLGVEYGWCVDFNR